jgi:neutral ceramidase
MTMNPAQFFKAGAARVDITPPLGTLINGFFLPRKALVIHDSLFVKAVYLETETIRLALVVVDTCVMALDYAQRVRLQVQEATGIPFQHISVCTTHTHAGGSVSEVHLCGPDPVYSEILPTKIVESVQLAIQNARPAQIAFGSVQVPEHVLCRRYIMKPGYQGTNPVTGNAEEVVTNPFGAEGGIAESAASPDPEVGYLAIRDLKGHWISILANYSLHYVGDWEKGTISADYFGEFERQLKLRLNVNSEFVGIMSNGTSGDVNCWDFLHPERYPTGQFRKSTLVAGDIAGRVVDSLAQITWEEKPELAVQYDELELGIHKPALEEVMTAEKIMQETDYTSLVMNADGIRRMYAREQVLL